MGIKRRPLQRLLTVATIVLGLLLGGCATQPQAQDVKPNDRIVVVLLDLSGSTQKYRQEYTASFQQVVSQVNYGDHLIVLSVDKDSIQNSKMYLDTVIPSFVKDDKKQPSQYMIDQARKKWESENPIDGIRASIVASMTPTITNTISNGSDLEGALEVASNLFSQSQATAKSLVVFSDMVLRDQYVNLDRKADRADPAKAMQKLKAAGAIADLKNVKVTVAGAVTSDQTAWRQIRDFWAFYFKESGSLMPLQRYNRNLSVDVAKDI